MSEPIEIRIVALIDYVNENFPDGCGDANCSDCPCDGAEPGTTEHGVCELLGGIEAYKEWASVMAPKEEA